MVTHTAVIYTRVSLDRDGTKVSPATQEAECRQLCEQRDWQVVGVYTDRNLSAFKRGVKRPEFDEMFRDLKAGKAAHLVAYKLDRLTRGGVVAAAKLLDKLEDAGAELTCVYGDVDTSTEMGKAVFGLFAAQARQESLNTSIRLSSACAQDAKAGNAHRGGSRQYGLSRASEIIEDEAAIVREAAQRVLAGESCRSIAIDLNARGVRTSRGNEWQSETLGQMLRSPKLTGLRVHRLMVNGVEVGSEMTEGNWDPILERETWTLLQERLTHTGIRRAAEGHFLTGGIAVCGRCGCSLKAMASRGFKRYRCAKHPGKPNCGRIAISEDSTDTYVIARLLSFLAKTELKPLDEATQYRAGLEAGIQDDEQSLVALTHARYVERSLTDEEYRPARESLYARLEASRRQLALLGDVTTDRLRPGSVEDLADWWNGLTLDEQRAVLRTNISRITILPGSRHVGSKLDRRRIKITWTSDLISRALEDKEGLLLDEGGNLYHFTVQSRSEPAYHHASAD